MTPVAERHVPAPGKIDQDDVHDAEHLASAVPAPPRARPRAHRPARPRRSALRPEIPQAEGDRIERPDADRIVVLGCRDRHPLPRAELERLLGTVRR